MSVPLALPGCRSIAILNTAIGAMAEQGVKDQLQIMRLKKRKLQLKDQIARVEDALLPEIIA